MKITFHGVGAALGATLDNTHFLIEAGGNKLQVDPSGGLLFAQKVRRKELYFEDIFITHVHTDHILGIFHLFRLVGNEIPKLNIYCSKKVESVIRLISGITLKNTINLMFDTGVIKFIHNDDLKEKNISDYLLKPINLHSKKMEQHGFILNYKDKKVVFFGDEAVGVLSRNDLESFANADIVICEGLIPENESIIGGGKINLEKMSHISAREAGRIAKKLNAKNLIIIHTKDFNNREQILYNDAKIEFEGNIYVPKDGDVLEF